MSLLEWFGLGLFVMGAVYTFRFMAGTIAWSSNYPDGFETSMAAFAGFFAGLFWPIALPILILREYGGGNVQNFILKRVYRVPIEQRAREKS